MDESGELESVGWIEVEKKKRTKIRTRHEGRGGKEQKYNKSNKAHPDRGGQKLNTGA